MLSFADLDADATARLSVVPTAVSLPRATIDALIAGGRDAVARNAAAQALTR